MGAVVADTLTIIWYLLNSTCQLINTGARSRFVCDSQLVILMCANVISQGLVGRRKKRSDRALSPK